MTVGIYKITNLINESVYIGKSKNIESRFANHRNPRVQRERKQQKLYNAILKYGIENFSFEIIEECPEEQLNEKECYGIKYYHSYYEDPEYKQGYNMTKGGDGRSSEEVKSWGANLPPEKEKQLRQKMIENRKNNNQPGHSQETKVKIGQAQHRYRQQHPYTEEEKYILASKTGTHIKAYDKQRNFVAEFPSFNYAFKNF